MSRQLSGQLSPSLTFKSSHSIGLSFFFFTRNVFTPNQLFKFEKKKKKSQVLCWYLVKTVIIISFFSSSYLPLIGYLIF